MGGGAQAPPRPLPSGHGFAEGPIGGIVGGFYGASTTPNRPRPQSTPLTALPNYPQSPQTLSPPLSTKGKQADLQPVGEKRGREGSSPLGEGDGERGGPRGRGGEGGPFLQHKHSPLFNSCQSLKCVVVIVLLCCMLLCIVVYCVDITLHCRPTLVNSFFLLRPSQHGCCRCVASVLNSHKRS